MLNPALDIPALTAQYRRKMRLQIRDFLTHEAAERIHQCLAQETPWGVTYNEGDKQVKLSKQDLAAMTAEDKSRRMRGAMDRARAEFQFVYHFYPIVQNYLAGNDPGLLLHSVLEFINTPDVIGFVRALTGVESVVKAEAQATLYAPGFFLTFHNDAKGLNNRRVAYVMSFTKNWNPDWGGLLQFFDDDHNITDVFVPRFNALSLFTVPQYHAVSYVPPFAPIGRYSITGWFLDPE